MSTTTLAAPIRVDTTGVHTRPSLGRLVAVELRKMVNTRAGFWLQVATVAITVVAVIVRSSSATPPTTPSPPSSTSGCSPRTSCCRSSGSCSSPLSGPSAPG